MELEFEYQMVSEKDSIIGLAQEPDSRLTKFFIADRRLSNESVLIDNGKFVDLKFRITPRLMTSSVVTDFGVKSFPHFGSYGFYTPRYSPSSVAVIPIYKTKKSPYPAPIVTFTDTGTTIKTIITNEEDVFYECYRIIVRKDAHATEFVTYNTEFEFIPMYDGECLITVYGHANEISVTSLPFEAVITLVDRMS